MHWRSLVAAAIALAASMVAFDAQAKDLYAATVRSQVTPGSTGLAGNLYTVDAGTGAATLIGPIRVEGATPVGITGLAVHPASGVMYGVTALASPNYPRSLVTIDPVTGNARLVGGLGATGSDIAFDARGDLFVWLRETSQLGTIDLATGAATALGKVGPAGPTGGLAIDERGNVYVTATGATGSLDTIDTATGGIRTGPPLSGAPFPSGINSMAASPDGVIFGVNTNLGSPATTLLVKIDPATGVVTRVGPLPDDTDALVFVPAPSAIWNLAFGTGTLLLLAGILAAITVAGLVAFGNRQRR